MKTTFFLIPIFMAMRTSSTFHFITRRWDYDPQRDLIDTLTTDNGNLFIARNNKMQWFRPLIDDEKPMVHLNRNFPRTIQQLSVKKTALLVNMSPENNRHMSESMVFVKGKCYSVLWKDNTMFETIVEKNGYLLRSNYFGDITYGDYKNIFTYNTRKYTNTTYSTMFVYDKYLWCAVEYIKNNTRMTRVDAFDLFVNINSTDYIASVPEMSFHIENKDCIQPCKLWVAIENYFPKKMIYFVVGYMRGGVNVAQTYYPPEKKEVSIMCSNLPSDKIIKSISFDMPYLFFLDQDGISSYKIFPRMDIHQYHGLYRIPEKFYSHINQIVSIKKQVFWNGEQVLHSAEVVED